MRSVRLVPALLVIAGCSQPSTDGPSLLPRAVENGSFDEPAAPPPAPVAADPALDARIARLAADAAAATQGYDAAERRAAPVLAAGRRARAGSDAWLEAQTALAGLEQQRAALLDVQTALDTLAADRAAAGQPPYPALAATQERVTAATADVAQRLAAQQALLPAQ